MNSEGSPRMSTFTRYTVYGIGRTSDHGGSPPSQVRTPGRRSQSHRCRDSWATSRSEPGGGIWTARVDSARSDPVMAGRAVPSTSGLLPRRYRCGSTDSLAAARSRASMSQRSGAGAGAYVVEVAMSGGDACRKGAVGQRRRSRGSPGHDRGWRHHFGNMKVTWRRRSQGGCPSGWTTFA